MDAITIRVTRAMCMRGERIEAGTTLKLPPLAAAEVLASGRAELLHKADAAACLAATRDSIKAALRAERASWQPPQVDGPWRPA